MAKKKKGWRHLWWGVGLGACVVACLMLVPLGHDIPRMKWRVPVRVDAPDIPTFDREDIKSLTQDVEQALPDFLTPQDEPPPVSYDEKGEEEKTAPPIVPAAKKEKGSGRIALIIDDMGLNVKNSARAVRLPAFVTLSYLPYASALEAQTRAAEAAGHDLMLHLPMEALGGEDAGPCALRTNQAPDEWQACLDKDLNAFAGYVGVNNHMGSKFSMDQKGMTFVSEVLLEKGVFFVDSRTSAKSIAQDVAKETGLRTAHRDVFLDDVVSAAAIDAELEHLERIARRGGTAIAIGHPHGLTLEALERWIPDAQARGLSIVPVRDLVE